MTPRVRKLGTSPPVHFSMRDVAVIVVSIPNEPDWLRPCLRTLFERLGPVDADVVVVDNSSGDRAGQLVRREFPAARVLNTENRGFAHANNQALMTCDARYVLFLNPDTETVAGTIAELIAMLDQRPDVGLVGVRQLLPDGTLYPTIRRFPNALRALAEALGCERLPGPFRRLGERQLDPRWYERDVRCDWTSGSFMLARREAIQSAGFLDERFFLSSEEVDFCHRIRQAGWDIRHLPQLTIIHHAGKGGIDERIEAQNTFTRVQYARKHFSLAHRAAYLGALLLRHLLRAFAPSRNRELGRRRRLAARRTLRTLLGVEPPPFGAPPRTALAPPTGNGDVMGTTGARRHDGSNGDGDGPYAKRSSLAG